MRWELSPNYTLRTGLSQASADVVDGCKGGHLLITPKGGMALQIGMKPKDERCSYDLLILITKLLIHKMLIVSSANVEGCISSVAQSLIK